MKELDDFAKEAARTYWTSDPRKVELATVIRAALRERAESLQAKVAELEREADRKALDAQVNTLLKQRQEGWDNAATQKVRAESLQSQLDRYTRLSEIGESLGGELEERERREELQSQLAAVLSLGDQLADWINSAGPALKGITDAYERRIRSLCSPEQLEKRPWECAEFIQARKILQSKPVAIVEINAAQGDPSP